MSHFRDEVIRQIQNILGYDFNEKELNPEIRAKIGQCEKLAYELTQIHSKIAKKGTPPYIKNLIYGIIFAFFLLLLSAISPFILILWFLFIILLIFWFPRARRKYIMERENLRKVYTEKYNQYFSMLIILAKEIHDELTEKYRLTLRPERVEYKIVANISLDKGVINIQCPYCSASLTLKKETIKGNVMKCEYCGKNIIVPQKIIDLI